MRYASEGYHNLKETEKAEQMCLGDSVMGKALTLPL